MSVKVEDYVEAARAIESALANRAVSHSADIMPALLVQATLSIAAAIIAEGASSSASASSPRPRLGAAC